ncbi:MAG: lipopolysaccharide heptosyltransferase I [Acidobacteria bacterium]|nr:lipopolysaccharide heptosyltransferase I [Acidobacteriota bacterium]
MKGARVLIVRLSALGDIVHAVPVLAALKRHDPSIEVDWLVEESYASVLALVDGIRQRIVVRARQASDDAVFAATAGGYLRAARFLRRQRYDIAIDLQGLLKSAVWARVSGATRVIGFAPSHLRERQAAWLYSETVEPPALPHVLHKNLTMATHLGAPPMPIVLPLAEQPSAGLRAALAAVPGRYAVLNPGAAWPNKRWPAERFAAVAQHLVTRHGLHVFVTWGPAERALADAIVSAAKGAAHLAPPTSIADLTALLRGAALVVSGDTGPMHIAAATGAPIVGLFGPTWPERNGPWDPRDEVISRATACQCHHKRQCLIGRPCIEDITMDEVVTAIDRRLAREA